MNLDVAPPGRESQVKALKSTSVDNPFAVAWASYNKSDDGIPGVNGTEPRKTGFMGTLGTYGQKRGEEPAKKSDDGDALREALGDDADMLNEEPCMDASCNDATHGHPVAAHAAADDGEGFDPDHDGDTHRDEPTALPDWDADPAVSRALNYGKSIPAPSNPPVSSRSGHAGSIALTPTSGQETLRK